MTGTEIWWVDPASGSLRRTTRVVDADGRVLAETNPMPAGVLPVDPAQAQQMIGQHASDARRTVLAATRRRAERRRELADEIMAAVRSGSDEGNGG